MSTKLITTIAELKEHVAIDFVKNFDVIAYTVEDRETWLRDTYLGEALFDELVALASGSSSSSGSDADKWAELLYYAQRAITNFAFMDYIPEGQLNISEKGIRIATNEEMKTAFEWQIKQLGAKYKKSGYDAIENMIVLLSSNLSLFTSWAGTDQHANLMAEFIFSAKDFNKYYNISENRIVFRELIPAIKKAEEFYIKPSIGTTYYDALKASVKSDELSTDDRVIVNLIKPAVAHLAIHIAMSEYGSAVKDMIVDYGKSSASVSNRNQMIQTMLESAENWGNRYLQKMIDYLDNNASETKYAAYYAYSQESSSYSASEDNRFYTNDKDDGIYVM